MKVVSKRGKASPKSSVGPLKSDTQTVVSLIIDRETGSDDRQAF